MKELLNNKKLIIIGIVAIIILSLVIGLICVLVEKNKNKSEIEVIIPLGSGTSTIAEILKENNIIKNKTMFKIYVKINKISDFKAGTYYLKPSMDYKEITGMLKTGIMHDPNQLTITYIEGKNMRWIANTISENTNNTEEDIYNLLKDQAYLNELINENTKIITLIKPQFEQP